MSALRCHAPTLCVPSRCRIPLCASAGAHSSRWCVPSPLPSSMREQNEGHTCPPGFRARAVRAPLLSAQTRRANDIPPSCRHTSPPCPRPLLSVRPSTVCPCSPGHTHEREGGKHCPLAQKREDERTVRAWPRSGAKTERGTACEQEVCASRRVNEARESGGPAVVGMSAPPCAQQRRKRGMRKPVPPLFCALHLSQRGHANPEVAPLLPPTGVTREREAAIKQEGVRPSPFPPPPPPPFARHGGARTGGGNEMERSPSSVCAQRGHSNRRAQTHVRCHSLPPICAQGRHANGVE
jgi:hypothetical protein